MKSTAAIISDKKHEIINLWEEAVRKEISASRITESLVLRDHLPNFLEDISMIMMYHEKNEVIQEQRIYDEIRKISLDHGRHRAASASYTVEQIVKEYMVLHRIMISYLLSKGEFTLEASIFISHAIETSMSHSAGSFTKSLQEMREKLVGTLAHDIRNPISAAYLAVDMMKHEDGPERFLKIRSMTLKSLRRSVELLEGLLDAIRVKAGEGITLDFAHWDIYEQLQTVHEEAIEIYSNDVNFKCNDEKIVGVFDPSAVKRAVENLVTNAVKYGDQSKPITITVENAPEIVAIKVHNYGNPIDPANQESIFNFLHRGPDESQVEVESWGMGLTLVKIVAEAHGGKAELESDSSNGTTFSIYLRKNANKPGRVKSRLNFS